MRLTLALAFILLNVLDVGLTWWGTRLGAVEANPLANVALGGGLAGLVAYKVLLGSVILFLLVLSISFIQRWLTRER